MIIRTTMMASVESGTALKISPWDLRRIRSNSAKFRELKSARALIIRSDEDQGGPESLKIPDWIAELTDLESLELGGNALRKFPRIVTEIRGLQYLGLSGTGLSEIDPDIGRLSNLTSLVLSGNELQSLPESLSELSLLRFLDLGRNLLVDIPSALRKLANLEKLAIWGNLFREIPWELSALSALRSLDLSRGGSVDLPNSKDLSLQSIHGYGTEMYGLVGSSPGDSPEFTSIPAWLPDAFPALQQLFLGGHKIGSLPHNMRQFTHLTGLFLAGNRIESIDVLAGLINMAQLDLRGNLLAKIPVRTLSDMSGLTYLGLSGNPLENIPPEVIERADEPAAIIDYASQIDKATRPLDEAKLLIVGEGSVGKSSLVRRLSRGEFSSNEGKTEGIDVSRWGLMADGRSVSLNVWDFGGQEIMHATHQFFLTKRSVYVLVVDARQGEEQNRIEYWLKLIQSFSGGSPVIIVGNKSDQAILDIDRRGLRVKYGDIVDIVSISCATGEGIGELVECLARTVGGLSHTHDLLPVAFFEIKRYLEGLPRDYLTFGEYEALCESHGIHEKSSRELLIGFLHDLGTVLCFRDDPRLADTNILSPSWVTGGVYLLLNSNLAAQRKGLLSWSDIDEILTGKSYPADRRPFIIDMMKKFELCYEDDKVFLIPDLLTKEEPDTGEWTDSLHFEISYDVLPTSIISRLAVRMNTAISKGTVWRTGMVLALDLNRALVKADREDAVITIDVSGPASGRRGLLTAVRTQLRAIERTIPGLSGEERVPVPDRPGVSIPYRHLLDLEAAGRSTVVPQGLIEDFKVKDLLGGVESPGDRKDVTGGSVMRADSVQQAKLSNASAGGIWSVDQSMRFGWFLLTSILVVSGSTAAAYYLVGKVVAFVVLGALSASSIIGVFVLRSAGRLSERGFLESLRLVFSTRSSKETETADPPILDK